MALRPAPLIAKLLSSNKLKTLVSLLKCFEEISFVKGFKHSQLNMFYSVLFLLCDVVNQSVCTGADGSQTLAAESVTGPGRLEVCIFMPIYYAL